MAPVPINTTELGLHESSISEPQPLRIIKRSKTVSGSSASGDSLCGRHGRSSRSSLRSTASSPMAADRPLTVRKLRKGRASILGSSMESDGDLGSGARVLGTPKKLFDDKDLTPKANPDHRVNSAGAFLKAEYHDNRDSNNDGYYSLRGDRYTVHRFVQSLESQTNNTPSSKNTSPTIPERRFSKSKNIFLRALGGNGEARPLPVRRSNSNTSRNTLVRRISRRKQPSIGSYCSSYDESTLSSGTASSFEPTNLDICDATLFSQSSSSSASEYVTDTPTRNVFVLYPNIMVTPEVSSLDAGLSIVWVAIQVTGILQAAEGPSSQSVERKVVLNSLKNPNPLDPINYGKLHSMRIDLHPGQGCTVLEIIGNLHESKTIRAGETELILAKIRVAKVRVPREGSEGTTEGMIADLQNHLGETISAYLTVRLTYKHTAFPNHKPLEPLDGMKLRMTRIETEATATIKRRNPESAWSPRTSQTISKPLDDGPVVKLVARHFPPAKAEEVKRRLAHDRSPMSIARKFGYWSEGSNGMDLDSSMNSERMTFRTGSAFDPFSTTDSQSRRSLRNSITSRPTQFPSCSSHSVNAPTQEEEIDPARKIWSEMRLTSRGGRHRHSRASISANHYLATEETKPPIRAISEDTHIFTPLQYSPKPGSVLTEELTFERDKTVDFAPKRKKSMGSETLKNNAPSVAGGRGDGKPKGGSATGLGLGVGRAWGWTSPWW